MAMPSDKRLVHIAGLPQIEGRPFVAITRAYFDSNGAELKRASGGLWVSIDQTAKSVDAIKRDLLDAKQAAVAFIALVDAELAKLEAPAAVSKGAKRK